MWKIECTKQESLQCKNVIVGENVMKNVIVGLIRLCS